MKTKLIALTVAAAFSTGALAECVPARVEIPFPKSAQGNTGMYHRVHPSGDYVLASGAYGEGHTSVSIWDLKNLDKGHAKVIKTPMVDETYPVEGSWKLFASPNHDGGTMKYFKFSDIKAKQEQATEIFSDSEHNQYYHSSAELPGSTGRKMKFRTMLWQNSVYRDYEVSFDANGKMTKETHTETKVACGNKQQLSSPILSKDGSEVATQDGNGHTVIYKIKADGSCDLVDEFGFDTGKVNFSYGNGSQVVFQASVRQDVNGNQEYVNGIWIYERCKAPAPAGCKRGPRRLSTPADSDNASYPGMTKDGRVIYIAEGKFVIVDPKQLHKDGTVNKNAKSCIQKPGGASTSTQSTPKKKAGQQ